MRFSHKVTALSFSGAVWLGLISAQAVDRPSASFASAIVNHQSTTGDQRTSDSPASSAVRATTPSGPALAAPATLGPTVGSATATTTPRQASTSTPSARPTTPTTATSPAYSAGGSMASSSTASQLYAQSTQSGWGCQAALQYLAQNANPKFQLVCPGDALGHQAMTCVDQASVCPDVAEIVIADPCPAAYKNEAWNSWHMETGPFDPYGWCSDWSNQQAPDAPPPFLSAGGSLEF